ncbi:MAG: sarcosine oxidase subunit gamma [Paracoccaceae bacterium]
MSDPVSALGQARYEGFVHVQDIGPLGMIALRAKPEVKALAKAIKAAVGTEVPAPRRIFIAGDKAAAWMSPDEYLLILPYGETDAAMAAIARAMGAEHHLAAVVSDARAVFEVTGERADQVLRKLMPVDFDSLAAGEIRRTRAAQVAAAFWAVPGGFRLVSFRSVAGYVMGLLTHSAKPGSELG